MNITFNGEKNNKNFFDSFYDYFHSFLRATVLLLCKLFLFVRNNDRITIVIISLTCVEQLLNRSLISVSGENECLT